MEAQLYHNGTVRNFKSNYYGERYIDASHGMYFVYGGHDRRIYAPNIEYDSDYDRIAFMFETLNYNNRSFVVKKHGYLKFIITAYMIIRTFLMLKAK